MAAYAFLPTVALCCPGIQQQRSRNGSDGIEQRIFLDQLVLLNQKKLAEGNPVESDKWRDSGRSIGGWDESGNGGLQ